MRTQPGQVIPDPTLNRRMNVPMSIGKPVPSAYIKRFVAAMKKADASGSPFSPPKLPNGVYTTAGRNSIFDHLELEVVEDAGQLKLMFNQPVYTINLEGGTSPKMRGFSLFSDAAKMGAPSFSLPAGPLREGGTCAAAGMHASELVRPARGSDPRGSRKDAFGNMFVCDACYATSGNYWYPTTSMAQASRLHWCISLLNKDQTGVELGKRLAHAIEWTARKATYNNLSKRMGQEFGVWRNGQIVVPGMVKHRGIMEVPVFSTPLPDGCGFTDTFDYFRQMNTPDGEVAGFFRIHDSGGLNVGRTVKDWIGYLNAWRVVAQSLPHVLFWLPVRTYHNRRMREALKKAAASASNLVIRASSMYIDGAPPTIQGLASSAVHNKAPQPDWYPCPVGPSDESSCTAVGCRTCWIFPDVIPSYKEH